jgi:hypothetical protein
LKTLLRLRAASGKRGLAPRHPPFIRRSVGPGLLLGFAREIRDNAAR